MFNSLRNSIILSLLFVAVNANGKFAVLSAPDSLDFQGNDPIQGEDVGEIVSAAMGGTVNGNTHWPCFTVVDPFKLPKQAVVALVDGVNVDITPAKYEYPVQGSGALKSLHLLAADMKEAHVPTCHVDYNAKKIKSANKCFGIAATSDLTTLPKTSSLNANDDPASSFLQSVGDLNGAIDNYLKQKSSKTVEPKDLIIVNLSLAPLVSAYGADSAQVTEATDLVKKSLAKLQKASGNALFVVVSGTEEPTKSRSKRQAVPASKDKKEEYNLAKYYDPVYPVIFNIILWFMVVFALALLAISYAIGSMDPGRDSIIYRMTSTRMKKDN